MIYISHNLGLFLKACAQVNVMYSGLVVEVGEDVDVFDRMRYPYQGNAVHLREPLAY